MGFGFGSKTTGNRGYFKNMKKFTAKEDKFIKQNYLKIPASAMSRMLGRVKVAAGQRMKILGLVVPDEIKKKFIEESRFKKGFTPVNKGKKMPKHVYKRCKATMFKKGQQPHNTKYDGAIITRKEVMRSGEIRMYKWIRISKGNWKMLHVFKWEQKHGPVPPGHIVVFKDKNPMNVTLRNLELITLQENMRRNSIHNLHPEIKKTIKTIASLKIKIKKHEKQIS